MRYRKKPVVIEALQWNGDWPEMVRFLGNCGYDLAVDTAGLHTFKIETLEGSMIVRLGDYVIKGVMGEYYPCREDIFKQTYEVV